MFASLDSPALFTVNSFDLFFHEVENEQAEAPIHPSVRSALVFQFPF